MTPADDLEHLGTTGNAWGRPGELGDVLVRLGTPWTPGDAWDVWRRLGTLWGAWGRLGTPEDAWGRLGTLGDAWGLLGTLGDVWGMSGDVW